MYPDEIPLGKAENLKGQKFGKLTALYRTTNATRNTTQWKCKCDCGNIVTIRATQLKSGKTKSCGCFRKDYSHSSHIKDISGQRFGRLVALYPNGVATNKAIIWHCKCDCGNEVDISGEYLRNGTSKSCGCLARELTSQRRLIDLSGQRFGKLVVLFRNGSTNYQKPLWHCKCDCGNEVDVVGSNLKRGTTRSCGCLATSYGEEAIKNLLNQYTIPYTTEKTFTDCIFQSTQRNARFDFYIENSYLIEYDGEQHFKVTGWWSTEDYLLQIQERDKYKNEYCKNHDIPLIRIPYTHLDNLCIEDLLLESSQFIVN